MIIETIVIDYLISCDLEGIGENIFAERPINPPDDYILIERTAGTKYNGVYNSMVAIQSISATSLYRAAAINDAVIEAMDIFKDVSNDIFGCSLNSNYNFTNTSTKEYRYQAVFDIHY